MLKFAGKACVSAAWLMVGLASAQQYSISTAAGGAPPLTPISATAISIGQPQRVAADSAGNYYFSSNNAVFKVNGGGTLSLVAGNSRAGFSGDGGPAVNAQLNSPQGVAVDKSGNIFISDSLNNRVRVVTPNGIINTYAGNGSLGTPRFVGDGGPATQANLHLPGGLAVDSNGNLYIADTANNYIRVVTASTGQINSIAGTGFAGYAGDADLAVNSVLNKPEDVAVDSSGNVYIADTGNALIRKITSDGNINYIAGSLTSGAPNIGYSGDNGPATSAGLIEPYGVYVDGSGNVYIVQPTDGRIRQVNTKGNITTIIGNGTLGFGGDGGPATAAILNRPYSVALDSSGNVLIADALNNRIRKVTSAGSGSISTVAGNGLFSYSGDFGPATSAQFYAPRAVAVDSSGSVYIADTSNNVIRRITSDGTVTSIAGTTAAGSAGDNGPAISAQLNAPQGIAVDSSGNVYIADTGNSKIRKISGGTITTYAGSGTPGYGGDGGSAANAQLRSPTGLALDASGNLYIADTLNSAIRKISGGNITTIAGNGNQGFSGDNGSATSAMLNFPQGVAVDASGNVYISDTVNNRVRLVSNGIITTVGGNGLPGQTGDSGPAITAQLGNPFCLTVDSAGGIYVSDNSAVVRKFFAGGPITTVAGNGTSGYTGDGGAAANAQLNRPTGISVDPQGRVYIADTFNNAVRVLQPSASGIKIAAVTNGASNATGAISPGEVIVLYGSSMGPSSVTSFQLSNGNVPTSVAGTSVYINGLAAPVLYSSASQVSAIVPFEVNGSAAQIYVTYQGQTSAAVSVSVSPATPSLFSLDFSGKGQAAAVNFTGGAINGSAHPVSAGQYVELYGTGFGQTNPSGQDGVITGSTLPIVTPAPTATVGGQTAQVTFAGGAPGSPAGVTQINIIVPAGLTAGPQSVVLQLGSGQTQTGITIAVSGN